MHPSEKSSLLTKVWEIADVGHFQVLCAVLLYTVVNLLESLYLLRTRTTNKRFVICLPVIPYFAVATACLLTNLVLVVARVVNLKPVFHWAMIFFRANKQKANVMWLGGDVVSVCRQPINCFFICSREQICLVENRLTALYFGAECRVLFHVLAFKH